MKDSCKDLGVLIQEKQIALAQKEEIMKDYDLKNVEKMVLQMGIKMLQDEI